MDFLVDLIQNYGYLIVFIGTLLEGETIVILAGFAAFQGHLSLEYVIPLAILGSSIGDHIFFYLGRFKGRAVLARRPHWHARVGKIHELLLRHQNWLIFGSRFMYGFRMAIPVVLGTSKVSALRFSLLNITGAIVWSTFFAFGGYLFGEAIEKFLGNVKKIEGYILLGIIIVVVLVQIVNWWIGRKEEELLEKEEVLHLTKEDNK